MSVQSKSSLASIPSVDRLLRRIDAGELSARFGRPAVTDAIRGVLAELRSTPGTTPASNPADEAAIMDHVAARLAEASKPSLRPVFNLTGTVLHTNLGRAALPAEAIEAVTLVVRGASNLEYKLEDGARGDRDDHLEQQLCRLTGAEAATVVNNNAAAMLLVLNTLALRKEVPASRGELIEIGGSFRLPDIMARAGCRLREVGTTNRTHLHDFEEAIGPKTGLVMKAHSSNYSIEGFTAAVAEPELARLCRERGVPFVVDLGSGTLIDLRRLGLPHEPTPMEALNNGADIVTFSGDKLLGGPQAGIIVGRAALLAKIKRNPMKRALRVDKMTIAALSAVLRLYFDPDRLVERVPTLRLLARPVEDIRTGAQRLCPLVAEHLDGIASVQVSDCNSQIGSGALPTQRVASAGLAIRPMSAGRGSGTALKRLTSAFRNLPVPVIGRIEGGAFVLDLRCLEQGDETAFVAQLANLALGASPAK
ncbi:MAG: L-seryl-tRNA(Sec) selenium transferase [Betaproteobacteria bacterium]|nr:L-seryl-tRNA(Sec) selenium transferase [Betaproteobacteria bacterium]